MSDKSYDAIIIGAGPGGCSAAARLAASGARVLLLEEKRMPREKLCGEFVTPESFPTLNRLGVIDRMMAAGAHKITRLSLVASNGKIIHAPVAEMSDVATWAMSLSRARFDQILFERASEAGATCLQAVAVKRCLYESGIARGVEAMSLADGKTVRFDARLIIDASGRNSRLMVSREERVGGRRGSRLFALKAHLQGVAGIDEQVELYFFPQGYGGLSRIEDGLVNLCFIVSESTMKSAGGDAFKIIERTVTKNVLARERLRGAEAAGKWLSAGPLSFGKRRLSQNGVIAIGDASGMIDPFTGTGMQIALRTGELAAESIIEICGANSGSTKTSEEARAARPSQARDDLRLEATSRSATSFDLHYFDPANGASPLAQDVLAAYRARYDREFGKRMAVAELLRGAAFSPAVANFLAGILARAPRLARAMLRATRSGPRPALEQL